MNIFRLSLLGSVCLLMFAFAATAAEETKIYQPVGAPADPKVPGRWNLYHDYPAASELLKQLAAAHPEICKLQSLGLSHGGREMWVLTVTNFKQGNPLERPAFWIDGGIHANEIQATEVVLYTAWFLLESYGRNPYITRLLDQRVFYLMPMMSPDSRDVHMHQAATTHTPRTGQRPVDDDRDGLVDEDKPNDLDGDGSITQMRIKDANGRWKKHPDYPELLIPAKPDEKGEYTLIDSEGFDDDGDGRVDEDADGQYDPNRNFPWDWQPQYVQFGAHDYPLSVLEDRLVDEFIAAHPHIAGGQSYHNCGGMILRGPGVKTSPYESSDAEMLKVIAARGEQLLPNYKSMEAGAELYEFHGGEIDWLYHGYGVLAFTNELFTAYNYFHEKSGGGGYFGTPEQAQRFSKLLLFGDGVVKWHEIDHPQFGKVEVGGLSRNWIRQPPSFMLEEECHRSMAFTLYHADQMPRIVVDEVNVKSLPGGVREVTATIGNERMIPTRLDIDVKNQLNPPDQVTLSGENVKVLAGFVASNRLFDKPVEQKREPETLKIDSIPGMSARYARWLITGEGPVTVTARSVKGGVASAKSE